MADETKQAKPDWERELVEQLATDALKERRRTRRWGIFFKLLTFTYIGLLETAARSYPPLAEAIGLPEGHEIQSVLILGYPKLKYLRLVDRKPLSVRWE